MSKFRKVLQNLWDKKYNNKAYSPNSFKEVLSKENPLFAGIQANDSKDLINFLVERFHQELNIVKQQNNINKPSGQANESSNNKSPQKINPMSNLNNKNQIYVNQTNNNNLSNQTMNSFNMLIQFYYKTLQCQNTVLNKMSQLFTQTNNVMLHTDIKNTINQLKIMLLNELFA